MIIDLEEMDPQKIQLTISTSFISLKDVDEEEEHVMLSKSDNINFTLYNNANKVVDELFESLFSRYQDNLETSVRGSGFIFDSVQLMIANFIK